MATPRKYPTLAEFEELKEAVARIECKLDAKPARASVYTDAERLADVLGLMDAYGMPVAVGDGLRTLAGDSCGIVKSISIVATSCAGLATVSVSLTGTARLTAVDMRLPGHAVEKKATA